MAQVVLESVIPSSRHAHVRLSLILFDLSFLLPPALPRLFPFLPLHALRPVLDSVTNNLRDSAKGSNDGYDVTFSLTLVENQDTILELTGKIQELQNEMNCMNDSRDFQDAQSVRNGHSNVTNQPVSFPPHPIALRAFKTCHTRNCSRERVAQDA